MGVSLHILPERFSGSWCAYGFSKWKRKFIPFFLGKQCDIQFTDNPSELSGAASWLVWSSKVTPDLELEAREQGVALWRMEDGFIRSVGLGVDLVPPLSLVMDLRGIYYDATRSSDLEWLLENAEFDARLLERAEALIATLVSTRITKYNVGKRSPPLFLPKNRRIFLVPGQVETDASIRLGSPRWCTNLELLQQVREGHPDAFIVYKPHPDVLAGGRTREANVGLIEQYYDLQVTDASMAELLEQVDEVHTLTSLTGFEALLRGVSVSTYGMPFYAGWGLTVDHLECKRRTRKLSLAQLVAVTLILYPLYINPDTGERITPEAAVELLRQRLGKIKGPSLKTRFYRAIKKMAGKQG